MEKDKSAGRDYISPYSFPYQYENYIRNKMGKLKTSDSVRLLALLC